MLHTSTEACISLLPACVWSIVFQTRAGSAQSPDLCWKPAITEGWFQDLVRGEREGEESFGGSGDHRASLFGAHCRGTTTLTWGWGYEGRRPFPRSLPDPLQLEGVGKRWKKRFERKEGKPEQRTEWSSASVKKRYLARLGGAGEPRAGVLRGST